MKYEKRQKDERGSRGERERGRARSAGKKKDK
jgi:hypothetical protein